MQSIMDNLCRCFGTTTAEDDPQHVRDTLETALTPTQPQGSSVPSTPDMKRRTRSLALQDKQWDNLFHPVPPSAATGGGPVHPNKARSRSCTASYSLEQAQAVAKVKLAASEQSYKRKRNRSSRDDIFRSKKNPPRYARPLHPVHRFLSNHPALMNSLCFATPVKGSSEGEPPEVPLRNNNSMLSDANTLHTADDTISSTVYYENTKLKGLQQKNPPMPLFDQFHVQDGDDIHRIVATHSHSSLKVGAASAQYNSNNASAQVVEEWNVSLSDDDDDDDDEDDGHHGKDIKADDVPPPMTHSSSSSSRSSTRR